MGETVFNPIYHLKLIDQKYIDLAISLICRNSVFLYSMQLDTINNRGDVMCIVHDIYLLKGTIKAHYQRRGTRRDKDKEN